MKIKLTHLCFVFLLIRQLRTSSSPSCIWIRPSCQSFCPFCQSRSR